VKANIRKTSNETNEELRRGFFIELLVNYNNTQRFRASKTDKKFGKKQAY
jgi:hypothetical protein